MSVEVGSSLLAALGASAIVIGPGVLATWLVLRQKRVDREARRSPLTTQLLRSPGHHLREKLEDGRVDLVFEVLQLMVAPGMAISALYVMSVLSGRHQPLGIQLVVALAVIAFTAVKLFGLRSQSQLLDRLRLGLDAEVAAGQELDRLMLQGAVVFHDLAGDDAKFNIDHVVIAPQGVFAVETKGPRKPKRDRGADDARVDYDGKVLRFPDWSSDKPLQQAQRNARWLAQWLTSATGQTTEVTPVVALPGWYVNRTGRGPVHVFSRTELERHLLTVKDARPISAEQVQRIVHQVEQRCRDVKPAYRDADED